MPSHERDSMKLVVFVKMHHPPIVVRLDQLAAGGQAGGSSSSAGSGQVPWNSQSFRTIVEEKLLGRRTNRRGRQAGPVKLLLDRDPVHINQCFKQFAREKGMKVCFLPPKAPDLDPLDYGIFGEVKKAWDQLCFSGRQSRQLDWDKQCKLLVSMLESVDPTPHIAALPSRIERCIQAGGSHFER